jgi:epoxyqueuosine reductase
MTLEQKIKEYAISLGFDLVGITDASPIDPQQAEIFKEWLASGFAAEMDYMRRNFDKRTNPATLFENAASVIVVGLNYKPAPEKLPNSSKPAGRVSVYACYEDYHSFIKDRLQALADFLKSIINNQSSIFNYKFCVDSIPLAERALALRAGLGFIGKNHMLINPQFGPQIFLGEIITTLKLQPDTPLNTNCSNCDKCIKACPTGALRPDGRFDASKCISYLTIEHKGQIPSPLATEIGDRLFGCDECVLACPYQHQSPASSNEQFKFRPGMQSLDLNWILSLSQSEFNAFFADSPVHRLGLARLQRNARICLDNCK